MGKSPKLSKIVAVVHSSAPAWSESSPPTFTAANSYIGSTVLHSYTVTYNGGTGGGNWYHFNILEAAKAWANGTQDPAKGLIFKASDSFESQTTNLWYKTFGSYNRSSHKPSLKIVYNASVSVNDSIIEIAEGQQKTITVTTNADNLSITWTSSNTNVATVDSNGVVTGIKAGTTTITATIPGMDPIERTVYVHIPNGIYSITNSYSNMALFVENLSILDGTNIVQTTLTPNAEETIVIRQLWKITYLGEGRHSIRPLHKLNMGLNCYSGNAEIKDITSNDTLGWVPDTAEWIIQTSTSGYSIFIKVNTGSPQFLQLANANTEINENVIVSTSSNEQKCFWNISPATNIPTGILLYGTQTGERVTNSIEYVAPGESRSLAQFNLAVSTYPTFNSSVSWTTASSATATVESSAGYTTGIATGTTTITGTYGGDSVSFTLNVTEIPEGTYFLRNKQTGYYADIAGPTMAEGTTIHQWQFHGGDSQKWVFDHVGDGYYVLESANENGGYYLGVKDDLSVDETPIVLRRAPYTDGMKWTITTTTSGAYRLTPKTCNMCLAVQDSAQENGIILHQDWYAGNNQSYRDEWYLHEEDYFMHALTNEFGFTQSQAAILNDMYYRVRDTYSGSSNMYISWKYSRLLGGLEYDHAAVVVGDILFTHIAGSGVPLSYT